MAAAVVVLAAAVVVVGRGGGGVTAAAAVPGAGAVAAGAPAAADVAVLVAIAMKRYVFGAVSTLELARRSGLYGCASPLCLNSRLAPGQGLRSTYNFPRSWQTHSRALVARRNRILCAGYGFSWMSGLAILVQPQGSTCRPARALPAIACSLM